MLEGLAKDESLKATQRLRALEELGRIESRRSGSAAAAPDTENLVFADPMADLDEMEQARAARVRRRTSRAS